MCSNPFSPLKLNKSSPSNNPKSVLNRRNIHKKGGLDIALHRADRRFRVNKSRALEKLHKDQKFTSVSAIAQGVLEKQIIGEMEDKRDAEKLGLEKEWLRKNESGEIAEDEDDLMSCDDKDDEKAEGEEGGEGVEMDEIRATELGPPVADDGDEEWEDTDDDKEKEVWSEDFIGSLLEIKKESGKEWLKKLETEKMAEAKWA